VTDDQGAVGWSYVRVDVTDGQCERPGVDAAWNDWYDYYRCRYLGKP
jgi:hypothetical protein